MAFKNRIAVAFGDGIGPEIMRAVLQMLEAAGASLELHPIEIGEKAYLAGHPSGIPPEAWQTLLHTDAFLKAPITTPQGGGFKSLNVSVRAALGLFANVRPCLSYTPFIKSHHPQMDIVIIRENEEDLYTGIEYQSSPDVVQALKMVSQTGCERIIRYSFEYAKSHGRKKVTAFTKDNILKLSDGLFHKVFDRIAKEYPTIESEHWIIDIGSAKLADTPHAFDVIVTLNLYGDIISDIAAQIAGSVGLAGSSNIGPHHAMFEAIHGSAPRRANQNMANPSGLLMGALMMLEHLGQSDIATRLYHAWARTLEEGIHTYDIYDEASSKQKVGTQEFAQAVCLRMGQIPSILPKRQTKAQAIDLSFAKTKIAQADHPSLPVGVDLFLYQPLIKKASEVVEALSVKLQSLLPEEYKLLFIANRGVLVWPTPQPFSACSDLWRCRIVAKSPKQAHHFLSLTAQLAQSSFDIRQLHLLYDYAGIAGYTLGPDQQ